MSMPGSREIVRTPVQHIEYVLASDIDNTLTGNHKALRRLGQQITELRQRDRLFLFLTTGRTLDEVIEGFERENIPEADAIISQVGTEIYVPPFSPTMKPLQKWDEFLHKMFVRERAREFVADIEGAVLQQDQYNTSLKVSYKLDDAPDPEAAAALIKQRVAGEGDGYRVIWSSGEDLDILPAASGKGKAIRFLVLNFALSPQSVIAAGDSGNDRSMLLEADCGIAVGNADDELRKLEGTAEASSIYFAKNFYAAGVEEGLQHFGVLTQ